MAVSEQERAVAINATDRLRSALAAARRDLFDAARDAVVYDIPTWADDEDEPPAEPVTELRGPEAVTTAIEALTAIDYADGQHPRGTRRAVGVLAVDANPDALIAPVLEAKKVWRDAMVPFTYNDWRKWRQAVSDWQRLHRLQAGRQWTTLNRQPLRVSWSWMREGHGFESIRIATLVERLEQQARHNPHTAIDDEIERLDNYDPAEVVAVRRPISPMPLANIRPGAGRARYVNKTPLPMIGPSLPREIGPLPNISDQPGREVRDDSLTETRPLIDYWDVYRYQAPYRFRVPHPPANMRLRRSGNRLTVMPRRSANAQPIWEGQTNPDALAYLADQAIDTLGEITQSAGRLAPDGPRLIAANRANAYVLADHAVWRIPIADLKSVAQ